MEESEFRRLLDLFPVVRSRDYQFELDSSRQSTSQSAAQNEFELDSSRQSTSQSAAQNELREWHDAWDETDKAMPSENQGIDVENAFWKKLMLVAGRKVGPVEAEKFCQQFQRIHKKLVYEGLSLDAARSYISSSTSS